MADPEVVPEHAGYGALGVDCGRQHRGLTASAGGGGAGSNGMCGGGGPGNRYSRQMARMDEQLRRLRAYTQHGQSAASAAAKAGSAIDSPRRPWSAGPSSAHGSTGATPNSTPPLGLEGKLNSRRSSPSSGGSHNSLPAAAAQDAQDGTAAGALKLLRAASAPRRLTPDFGGPGSATATAAALTAAAATLPPSIGGGASSSASTPRSSCGHGGHAGGTSGGLSLSTRDGSEGRASSAEDDRSRDGAARSRASSATRSGGSNRSTPRPAASKAPAGPCYPGVASGFGASTGILRRAHALDHEGEQRLSRSPRSRPLVYADAGANGRLSSGPSSGRSTRPGSVELSSPAAKEKDKDKDKERVAGVPCRLRGEVAHSERKAHFSQPPAVVVEGESCRTAQEWRELEALLELSERRASSLQEELVQRDAEIERLRSTEEDMRKQEAQVRRRALEEVRAVRAEVAETWQQHLDLRSELAEAEAKQRSSMGPPAANASNGYGCCGDSDECPIAMDAARAQSDAWREWQSAHRPVLVYPGTDASDMCPSIDAEELGAQAVAAAVAAACPVLVYPGAEVQVWPPPLQSGQQMPPQPAPGGPLPSQSLPRMPSIPEGGAEGQCSDDD